MGFELRILKFKRYHFSPHSSEIDYDNQPTLMVAKKEYLAMNEAIPMPVLRKTVGYSSAV